MDTRNHPSRTTATFLSPAGHIGAFLPAPTTPPLATQVSAARAIPCDSPHRHTAQRPGVTTRPVAKHHLPARVHSARTDVPGLFTASRTAAAPP